MKDSYTVELGDKKKRRFFNFELGDRATAIMGVVGITALVASAVAGLWLSFKHLTTPMIALEEIREDLPAAAAAVTPSFPAVEIGGKAAVVYDLTTHEILYKKNAEEQLPLASLTKLMTALVASETLAADAVIPVTDDALLSEGDSGFFTGERFVFQELLAFTLITSSNDGARAISAAAGDSIAPSSSATSRRATFIEEMNAEARKLGLAQTYFVNETGLDMSPTAAGAYGSARDVAELLATVVEKAPEVLHATTENGTSYESLSGVSHTAENTNEFAETVPGLIASKTGYTDLAGGNLAVLVDTGLNHPVAIVVLGSSQDGRFRDVKYLLETTRTYLQEL